jgi:mono/diheme cytochrome c family protein
MRKDDEMMFGRSVIGSTLLGLAVMGVAPAALGQAGPDSGQREYEANCMVCHGAKAKGDGPYMAVLGKPPSDLTTLARRNGGVFPVDRVYRIIDGRDELKAHGPREMPVWGIDYQVQAATYWRGRGSYDPELFVRYRILALIDYLSRVQEK